VYASFGRFLLIRRHILKRRPPANPDLRERGTTSSYCGGLTLVSQGSHSWPSLTKRGKDAGDDGVLLDADRPCVDCLCWQDA
jgi:hypothetical protein